MKKNSLKISRQAQKQEMVWDLENDYERFPLPICFDPYAEQQQLYGRKRMIERFVERYFRLYKKATE